MKDNEIGPLLFLSGESFTRLMGHMHREEIASETKKREKAYKKKLKQQSDEMAEKWPDSIQNIKTRERERWEMKEQLREEMRTGQSEYYKEFHRKEREKFLAEIRDKMKMKRAPNLALSNALVESHIRRENEANIKMKEEKRREEEEKEAKWVELVHETVKEFKRNEEEEKCKARGKSKLVQAFQLKQIEEKIQTNLHEKTKQLREEREDLNKSNDEIKERKDNELEDYKNHKMDMKEYMRSYSHRKEREKDTVEREEAEMREVCSIYNDFYKRRCCNIEKQKKQEREDLIEANHKLGILNKRKEDSKEVKENQIWMKQYMEEENKYQQKRTEETNRKEENQKGMNAYYSDFNTKMKKRENERAEVLRFKLAERLKDTEENMKYEEEKKKKIRGSGVEFSKEWGKQIEVRKEYTQKKTSEKCLRNIHELEDEKFLGYARDVLEHVRSNGMDDYPMKREINKYCRNNQLPMYPDCLRIENGPSPTPRTSRVKLPKI